MIMFRKTLDDIGPKIIKFAKGFKANIIVIFYWCIEIFHTMLVNQPLGSISITLSF